MDTKETIGWDKNKWQREYWAKHPDKYKIHLQNVIAYSKTEKGKENRLRAIENRKLNNPNYHVEYSRKRKEECIKNGMCIECHKPKLDDGRNTCDYCREKRRRMYNIRRLDNKYAKSLE